MLSSQSLLNASRETNSGYGQYLIRLNFEQRHNIHFALCLALSVKTERWFKKKQKTKTKTELRSSKRPWNSQYVGNVPFWILYYGNSWDRAGGHIPTQRCRKGQDFMKIRTRCFHVNKSYSKTNRWRGEDKGLNKERSLWKTQKHEKMGWLNWLDIILCGKVVIKRWS